MSGPPSGNLPCNGGNKHYTCGSQPGAIFNPRGTLGYHSLRRELLFASTVQRSVLLNILQPGKVIHTCNPSNQQALSQVDCHKLEASLGLYNKTVSQIFFLTKGAESIA